MSGITGFNNVTWNNVTAVSNASSIPELLVSNNTIIFGGTFWFIMLFVIWIIIIAGAYRFNDQLLNSIMYSSAICSMLAFLLRAICFNNVCLLSVHLLWVFPILTAVFGFIVWISQK